MKEIIILGAQNYEAPKHSNYGDWSYVNILDTKSQTFLCCTSS